MSFAASETSNLQRYVLVNGSSRTWSDAQAHCRKNYTDLARVRSQQENEALQKMVTGKPVWLGLKMQSWVWSDGSQPSFVPWEYHKYTNNRGDCGALVFGRRNHGLIRMSCSENASFFCYSGKHIDLLAHFKFARKVTSSSSFTNTI